MLTLGKRRLLYSMSTLVVLVMSNCQHGAHIFVMGAPPVKRDTMTTCDGYMYVHAEGTLKQ